MAFFGELQLYISGQCGDAAKNASAEPLGRALGHLQQATMWFMQNAVGKPDNAGAGATDYMHLFGLVALGYMWCRIAVAAQAARAADTSGRMEAKLVTA